VLTAGRPLRARLADALAGPRISTQLGIALAWVRGGRAGRGREGWGKRRQGEEKGLRRGGLEKRRA
jgi:hypothetical protein